MNTRHDVTSEGQERVRAAASAGIPQALIARFMGIDEKTLRKYYADELECGLAKTVANVANTLVQKALNGDTACAIFYLKTQGARYGWSEKQSVEMTGKDGGAIQVDHGAADQAKRKLFTVIAATGGEGVGGKPNAG